MTRTVGRPCRPPAILAESDQLSVPGTGQMVFVLCASRGHRVDELLRLADERVQVRRRP